MIIGIPKEIKDNEYRVALPPGGVRELVRHGHRVFVQTAAGAGSAFSDEEYLRAGATIVQSAAEAWGEAQMVLKVKEPQPQEYGFLRMIWCCLPICIWRLMNNKPMPCWIAV